MKVVRRDPRPLGHVSAVAVMVKGTLQMLDPEGYARDVRQMRIGDGEEVEIRVSRAADAKQHSQLRWYFGYIVKQSAESTGYTLREMDAIFRVECLPPGTVTISTLTYDEMRDFILACEVYAAQTIGVVISGPDEIRKRAA